MKIIDVEDQTGRSRFLPDLLGADELRARSASVMTDRSPCVYILWLKGEAVYVGQTAAPGGLLARLGQHAALGKEFDAYTCLPCRKRDLDVLEALYIHTLNPPLNSLWRDVSAGADGLLVLGARRQRRRP